MVLITHFPATLSASLKFQHWYQVGFNAATTTHSSASTSCTPSLSSTQTIGKTHQHHARQIHHEETPREKSKLNCSGHVRARCPLYPSMRVQPSPAQSRMGLTTVAWIRRMVHMKRCSTEPRPGRAPSHPAPTRGK